MATTLEELVIKFEADLSGLRGDLKKVEDAIGNTGKKVDRIGNQISTTLKTALAGAASYAALKFYELIKSSEDEALALKAAAAAANVGTEALQQLRFAAEGVGSSAEDMDQILIRLNKRLGEARAGSEEAARQFRALGLEALVKNGATTDVALRGIADALSQIDDPAKADAIAMKILGDRASTVTALLRGGSAELNNWASKATAAGIQSKAMTDELAESARETRELNKWVKNLAADVDLILIRTLRGAVGALEDLGAAMRDFRRESERQKNQGFLGSTVNDILEGTRNFGKTPAPPTIKQETIDLGKPQFKPRKIGNVNSFFDTKGADEARAAAERFDKAVEELLFDMDQLGRTEEEASYQTELHNRLNAAGVKIDSDRGRAIEELTSQYYSLQQAHEAEQAMWEVEAAEANRAIAEINEALRREAEEWISLGEYVEETLADALVAVAMNAKDAKQIIAELIVEIGRAIAKMLILKAIEAGINAVFGGVGGGSGGGSGKAMGGLANAGNAYTVGEAGPELFVPRVSGQIVPNNRIGGGSFAYAPVFHIAPGVTKSELMAVLNNYNRDLFKRLPAFISNGAYGGAIKVN